MSTNLQKELETKDQPHGKNVIESQEKLWQPKSQANFPVGIITS